MKTVDLDAAKRLRRVCKLLGLEDAVPAGDADLMTVQFAVFGMIASAIERKFQKCGVPTSGWTCSRVKGHTGPCAASVCACGAECQDTGEGKCRYVVPTQGADARPVAIPILSSVTFVKLIRRPDANDTVCIGIDDLRLIIERHLDGEVPPITSSGEGEALRAFDKSVSDGYKHDLESYTAGYIDSSYACRDRGLELARLVVDAAESGDEMAVVEAAHKLLAARDAAPSDATRGVFKGEMDVFGDGSRSYRFPEMYELAPGRYEVTCTIAATAPVEKT